MKGPAPRYTRGGPDANPVLTGLTELRERGPIETILYIPGFVRA